MLEKREEIEYSVNIQFPHRNFLPCHFTSQFRAMVNDEDAEDEKTTRTQKL